MYSLINKYKNQIIEQIGNTHVGDYDWLLDNLGKKNVSIDLDYKRRYRRFWAMNAALLPDDFLDVYFKYLEDNKNNQNVNLKEVCEYLYEFPTDKKDNKSLQFSFATKLVHMVTPNMPIYDRMIKDFYFLPGLQIKSNFQRRLLHYILIYDFLKEEYQRILDGNYLQEAIQTFRNQLKPKTFSDEKIIDSLIWQFVGMAKKGAFIIKKIQYC